MEPQPPRAQAPRMPWKYGMPWPAGHVLRPQQEQPPGPPVPQKEHFDQAARSIQGMNGMFDRFVTLAESRARAHARREVIQERHEAIGGLMMPKERAEVDRLEGEAMRLTDEMVGQREQIMTLFHNYALSGAVLLTIGRSGDVCGGGRPPPPRPAQQVPPPTVPAQQPAARIPAERWTRDETPPMD